MCTNSEDANADANAETNTATFSDSNVSVLMVKAEKHEICGALPEGMSRILSECHGGGPKRRFACSATISTSAG